MGTVVVYFGNEGVLFSTIYLWVVGGIKGGDRFGYIVVVVGDFNGDKVVELVMYAIYEDMLGFNVGVVY